MAASGVRALRRSGFVGMRTQVRQRRTHPSRMRSHERAATQDDEDELDLEAFNMLEFRVRVRLPRFRAPGLARAHARRAWLPGRRPQVHRHAAHRQLDLAAGTRATLPRSRLPPHACATGCRTRPLAGVSFRPCERVGRRASAHLALHQDLARQGTAARAASAALHRLTLASMQVLESEHEMDTSRILSVGISLAGGGVLEVRPRCAVRLRSGVPT